jgi:hypothetical protein
MFDGPTVKKPSKDLMVPSPSWSSPRPPSVNVTGSAAPALTASVPSGPKALPITLM